VKCSSRNTEVIDSGLADASIRGRKSTNAATRDASLRSNCNRGTHLVSQDEVVYAGDCVAISEDKLKLFRTQ
jgi:hypothetical protein